ncbi:hypothetical protein UO65_0642 [Actinokineospora spheciospongiae]|uniref:Uncharacterized protein n=1 Tax=Actinokineospora spheciospongiae TaxID=909613 RepID=W7J4U0_9PSEU|nr:hypothetical protein [Actinokineospora spheciospongiae]EWC64021.1 hypothetical protein UO65_0642 [Actinokineospora spheciospongiae]
MDWAQTPDADNTPFYASGTFWAIAAVAVAIAAIGVGAWAAWRSANPKRQLNIWIGSDTPLMTTRAEGITVGFEGTPLADPHIVRVQIAARGRKDIVPADFAGPLRIDLATPVLRLIATHSTTKRDNLPAPALTVDDTALVLDPTILPGDQRTTLDVLLDSTPELAVTAPLANVTVKKTDPNPSPSPRQKPLMDGFLLGMGFMAGTSILAPVAADIVTASGFSDTISVVVGLTGVLLTSACGAGLIIALSRISKADQ